MEAIWDWGIALIIAMQSAGEGLGSFWRAVSVLGDEIFFLLLIPLLFWCVSPRVGIRVGLVLLLGTTINSFCKLALAGPRPYWYSPEVRVFTAESSFGLPSAHAQNTVGVWGALAASIARPWACDYGDPGAAGGAFTYGSGCSLPNRCARGDGC